MFTEQCRGWWQVGPANDPSKRGTDRGSVGRYLQDPPVDRWERPPVTARGGFSRWRSRYGKPRGRVTIPLVDGRIYDNEGVNSSRSFGVTHQRGLHTPAEHSHAEQRWSSIQPERESPHAGRRIPRSAAWTRPRGCGELPPRPPGRAASRRRPFLRRGAGGGPANPRCSGRAARIPKGKIPYLCRPTYPRTYPTPPQRCPGVLCGGTENGQVLNQQPRRATSPGGAAPPSPPQTHGDMVYRSEPGGAEQRLLRAHKLWSWLQVPRQTPRPCGRFGV